MYNFFNLFSLNKLHSLRLLYPRCRVVSEEGSSSTLNFCILERFRSRTFRLLHFYAIKDGIYVKLSLGALIYFNLFKSSIFYFLYRRFIFSFLSSSTARALQTFSKMFHSSIFWKAMASDLCLIVFIVFFSILNYLN